MSPAASCSALGPEISSLRLLLSSGGSLSLLDIVSLVSPCVNRVLSLHSLILSCDRLFKGHFVVLSPWHPLSPPAPCSSWRAARCQSSVDPCCLGPAPRPGAQSRLVHLQATRECCRSGSPWLWGRFASLLPRFLEETCLSPTSMGQRLQSSWPQARRFPTVCPRLELVQRWPTSSILRHLTGCGTALPCRAWGPLGALLPPRSCSGPLLPGSCLTPALLWAPGLTC